ncbi:MAG: hypothetical protein ACOC41_03300 [Chitinivibrionales bacterium]
MKAILKAALGALAFVGLISALKNKKSGKHAGRKVDQAIAKAGKYFEHAAHEIRKSGKHHDAQRVGRVIDQAVSKAKSELEKSGDKVRKHAMSMSK